MNHLIVVKFKSEYSKSEILKMFEDIKTIFNQATTIPGINDVVYKTNCIDRTNRYDILINIIMDKEALPLWDESSFHKQWKDTYGHMIESKCIFDCE